MDIGVIQFRLNLIDHLKHDSGKAHMLEDELYHDFIKFLSGYPLVSSYVQSMAKEVLKSKEIKFGRFKS